MSDCRIFRENILCFIYTYIFFFAMSASELAKQRCKRWRLPLEIYSQQCLRLLIYYHIIILSQSYHNVFANFLILIFRILCSKGSEKINSFVKSCNCYLPLGYNATVQLSVRFWIGENNTALQTRRKFIDLVIYSGSSKDEIMNFLELAKKMEVTLRMCHKILYRIQLLDVP